jgi:hypothetical protein
MQNADKLDFATDILVEAGVLKPCEDHVDYFKVTGRDVQNAYRLANARFPSGRLPQGFSGRREMTDTIKEAADHHYYPGRECPRCDQLRDRD